MSDKEKEVNAILRIEGGTADEGILDVHDAANTIYGIARAINIVAHSFANNEEIRTRANSANGAQAFIHSSKKGCFEEQIDVRFSDRVTARVGHSVIVNYFWDYLVCCWGAAIGVPVEAETPYLKKVLGRDPDFIHEIADALESSMQDLHRSISKDPEVTIFLARPRVGDQLLFNSESLDFVTTREIKSEITTIEANITRYNVLSHFGRFYSDMDGKVLSFELYNTGDRRLESLVVESMKKKVDGKGGKLLLKVSSIVNASDVVKRYVVHEAQAVGDNE